MKTAALVLLLVGWVSADATGRDDERSDQTQEQNQSQNQDQYQDQNQGQSQEQFNDQTQAISGQFGVTTFKRGAASAIAPNVYPTSPCINTASAGAQSRLFGVSVGGGKVDPGCEEREIIRMAPTQAHRLFMWCHQELAVERFGTAQKCMDHAPISVETNYETVAEELQLAAISEAEIMALLAKLQNQERAIEALAARVAKAERQNDRQTKASVAKRREAEDFIEQVKAIAERKYGDE